LALTVVSCEPDAQTWLRQRGSVVYNVEGYIKLATAGAFWTQGARCSRFW
jgi:hypothetical protein